MHVAGRSIRDIARALKVPRSTIGRAIMAARLSDKPELDGEVSLSGKHPVALGSVAPVERKVP
jgi:DNA-directed RNA polymerase specialized sigma24 family protein